MNVVKGLGTDLLRTGRRCPLAMSSVRRPLALWGVAGGVFLGMRLLLLLLVVGVPLALVGDPFCVVSSTPESASVSGKIKIRNY